MIEIELTLLVILTVLLHMLATQIAWIIINRQWHGGIMASWRALCRTNEADFEQVLLALHHRTSNTPETVSEVQL